MQLFYIKLRDHHFHISELTLNVCICLIITILQRHQSQYHHKIESLYLVGAFN